MLKRIAFPLVLLVVLSMSARAQEGCYIFTASVNQPDWGFVVQSFPTCSGGLYAPFSRTYATASARSGYKFCGWYATGWANVCGGVTSPSCRFIKAAYDEYALAVFMPTNQPCPP